MTRDIAERIAAALENPAVEFEPDGTPKLGNLMRDALSEIRRLRALTAQQDGAREGHTLVPNTALEWLFGSGPDT